MWGPSNGAADPIFPVKKASFFSSPQKLATFFAHHSFHSGIAHYFPHAKICRSFCGALFCEARVRPNMLSMPKSAAAPTLTRLAHNRLSSLIVLNLLSWNARNHRFSFCY